MKFNDIDIDKLREQVESGDFTHNDIVSTFGITKRQLQYLIVKFTLTNNLIVDRSYMRTDEYKNKISVKNTGKLRTEEQKQHYKDAANKREIKNNVGSGWHHSKETVKKITESNIKTYSTLPQKWLDSCINNDDWFRKLSENAPLTKSAEHTRKSVEAKVGMSYKEWQIVRGEYNKYCAEVRKITTAQPLSNLINYDKRGSEYHVDHKFSMCEGFRQQISPEIIGHITNLTMITSQENITKNKKCSVTLQQLLEGYDEYCKRSQQ